MNKIQNNTTKPWWRDGVIVFTKVSAYIAIPVIIASYIGQYLDNKYSTGNSLFLVLVGIAFFTTIYLIWREMKVYKNKLDKEITEKK